MERVTGAFRWAGSAVLGYKQKGPLTLGVVLPGVLGLLCRRESRSEENIVSKIGVVLWLVSAVNLCALALHTVFTSRAELKVSLAHIKRCTSFEERLEACRHLIKKDPRQATLVATQLAEVGFKDDLAKCPSVHARLDCLQQLLGLDRAFIPAVVDHISLFDLKQLPLHERLKVAHALVSASAIAAEHIQEIYTHLGLADANPSDLEPICHAAIQQGEGATAAVIEAWELLKVSNLSPDHLLKVCHAVISKGALAAQTFVAHLTNLGLHRVSPADRLRLAYSVLKVSSHTAGALLAQSKAFNLIQVPLGDRVKLCHALLEANPALRTELPLYLEALGFWEDVLEATPQHDLERVRTQLATLGAELVAAVDERLVYECVTKHPISKDSKVE